MCTWGTTQSSLQCGSECEAAKRSTGAQSSRRGVDGALFLRGTWNTDMLERSCMLPLEEDVSALFKWQCIKRRTQFPSVISQEYRRCAKKGSWIRAYYQLGQKTLARIWMQVSQDHEARDGCMRSIMLKSTDFFKHVVGEAEGKGTIISTEVCERCKFFPKTSCGEAGRTEYTLHEWLVVLIVRQRNKWRNQNRLLFLQVGTQSARVRQHDLCAEVDHIFDEGQQVGGGGCEKLGRRKQARNNSWVFETLHLNRQQVWRFQTLIWKITRTLGWKKRATS